MTSFIYALFVSAPTSTNKFEFMPDLANNPTTLSSLTAVEPVVAAFARPFVQDRK